MFHVQYSAPIIDKGLRAVLLAPPIPARSTEAAGLLQGMRHPPEFNALAAARRNGILIRGIAVGCQVGRGLPPCHLLHNPWRGWICLTQGAKQRPNHSTASPSFRPGIQACIAPSRRWFCCSPLSSQACFHCSTMVLRLSHTFLAGPLLFLLFTHGHLFSLLRILAILSSVP